MIQTSCFCRAFVEQNKPYILGFFKFWLGPEKNPSTQLKRTALKLDVKVESDLQLKTNAKSQSRRILQNYIFTWSYENRVSKHFVVLLTSPAYYSFFTELFAHVFLCSFCG